jgi:hypothetical protein
MEAVAQNILSTIDGLAREIAQRVQATQQDRNIEGIVETAVAEVLVEWLQTCLGSPRTS